MNNVLLMINDHNTVIQYHDKLLPKAQNQNKSLSGLSTKS